MYGKGGPPVQYGAADGAVDQPPPSRVETLKAGLDHCVFAFGESSSSVVWLPVCSDAAG